MSTIGHEYSPWKGAHWTDRLNALRRGARPAPVHVQLVPTNKCNHSCSFCAYRTPGWISNEQFTPRAELTTESLLGLLRDFAGMGVAAVQFTGGGEPLCHPAIGQALKLTVDLGMRAALVTNGTLLEQCGLTEMVAREMDWVRVSLDAGRPETYARIRRCLPGHMTRALDAVQKMSGTAQRKATIGVGYVVTEDNWPEVFLAARAAYHNGADNIRISLDVTSAWEPPQEAIDLAHQAKEHLEDREFQVFNLLGRRVNERQAPDGDCARCVQRDLATYVGADSRLYTCCVLAYSEEGDIGPVGPATFEDAWFHNPRPSPNGNCQGPPCMFHEKNEFLRYLLESHPQHVEFV